MTDEDFRRLVTLYLEDSIEPGELEQLNRELSDSPDRVKQFNDLRLLSGLILEHGKSAVTDQVPLAFSQANSRRPWSGEWKVAAMFVAMGIITGCLGTGVIWAFNHNVATGVSFELALGVHDGGFESGEYPGDLGYPVLPGIWTGDPAEVVESGDQGIRAYEGTQMLRFQKTAGNEEDGRKQRANRWQIVSLGEVALSDTPVIATARARFNRVAGGPETDTQVRVEIAAFSGSPSTAEQQLDSVEFLTRTITRVEIDSDPGSWEAVKASIIVPEDADFLLIGVAADENVFNNPPDEVEFDGHYVDAVELVLSQAGGLLPKKKRKLFTSQSNHDLDS